MTTPRTRTTTRRAPAKAEDRIAGRARGRLGDTPARARGLDASAVGHDPGHEPRSVVTPASAHLEAAMAPSSWRRAGTRSRSSSPRRRTGSRTCCRSATDGWPPRPSRSIAVRRRSWPSTCRRRRGATSSSRHRGDAHLSNFGLFASPERTLVFDSNDFDETLPGPWEWDVKRLGGQRGHRRPEQRVHTGRGARGDPRHGGRLSRPDGALLGDAAARHLVRPDDRRSTSRTRWPRQAKQLDVKALGKDGTRPRSRRYSPRPAARTR